MTTQLLDRKTLQEDVLWDRRSQSRLARTEAFRLLAAAGRRTSNRVAGILMRSRISRADGAVVVECRPESASALRRAEPAIADAVESVFGPQTRLALVTMPLFEATG